MTEKSKTAHFLDDLVEVQVTVDPGYQMKITQLVKEVVND
jgi:hypothetical protein